MMTSFHVMNAIVVKEAIVAGGTIIGVFGGYFLAPKLVSLPLDKNTENLFLEKVSYEETSPNETIEKPKANNDSPKNNNLESKTVQTELKTEDRTETDDHRIDNFKKLSNYNQKILSPLIIKHIEKVWGNWRRQTDNNLAALVTLSNKFEEGFEKDAYSSTSSTQKVPWHQSIKDWYKGHHKEILKQLIRELGQYFDHVMNEYIRGINVHAKWWFDKVADLHNHNNIDQQLQRLISEFNKKSKDHEKKVLAEAKTRFEAFKKKAGRELMRIAPRYIALTANWGAIHFSESTEDIVKFSEDIKSEVFKAWFKSRSDLSRNLVFRGITLFPEGERIPPNRDVKGHREAAPRRSAIRIIPRSNINWSELVGGKFTMAPQHPPFF